MIILRKKQGSFIINKQNRENLPVNSLQPNSIISRVQNQKLALTRMNIFPKYSSTKCIDTICSAARRLKIQYSDSNYLQTGLLQINMLKKKKGCLVTHTCGLILIQSKGILQVFAGHSVKISYYLITIRKKFWILYIILFKKESMAHFKYGRTNFQLTVILQESSFKIKILIKIKILPLHIFSTKSHGKINRSILM